MTDAVRTSGVMKTVISTVAGDPRRGPTATPHRGIQLEVKQADGRPHFDWVMTLEGAESVARQLLEQVRRTREFDAANAAADRPAPK